MSVRLTPEKWESIMADYVSSAVQRKEQLGLDYVDIAEEVTEYNVSALAKALKSQGITQFTNSYFGLATAGELLRKMADLRENGFAAKMEILIPDYTYNHNHGISNDAPDAFKKRALLFEQIS